MTPYENIETALFNRVRDYVTMLPVAWPNVEFNPPVPHKYVTVTHHRNQNERLFLRGVEQHRMGFLQLSVVYPLGEGSPSGLAMAGTIAAGFPQDMVLTSETVKVRITKEPDAMSAIQTDVSWIIPISVYYEAFV